MKSKFAFVLAVLSLSTLALWAAPTLAAKPGSVVCSTGLAAYQATLYPVQRQYCAQCHDDDGIAIRHSSADPALAYSITRKLIDFGRLDQSTLISKLKEKHWLQHDGPAIPLEPSQVETLIQAWWDQGEHSCPSSKGLLSAAIAIPAPLPATASGQFVTMHWDLTSVDPKFAGCVFELDIQRFTETQAAIPGSYRVKNLRAGCPGKTLHVTGIWLPVSGETQDYENYFQSVDQTVSPMASPTDLSILSKDIGILIQKKTSGDTLSVLFETLEIQP